MRNDKLEPFASKDFPNDIDLYKIIDFLNKTLSKKYNLIFGISKVDDEHLNITIYEI